jgi:hypothetical protein
MPRVYAYFFPRHGWYVQFVEEDVKTPLRKKLVFQTADKIVETCKRGGALDDSEAEALLDS